MRFALLSALVVAFAAAIAGPANAAGKPIPADVHDVCGPAAPGTVRCFAQLRTDVHGGAGPRARTALPQGYGPADLRSAYRLPDAGGDGQTVAIVDAGDNPNAEADLAVYRAAYGLPPCTTGNGCFRKVNQAGEASPLPTDLGWGSEIALDLDMVSAVCSACHILLVEADSPSVADMAAAVDTAAALGATVISNSYGASESNGMQAYATSYRHPGIAVVASSGDSGYGIPNVPAAYDNVIAVGGTTLTAANTERGWAEAAWAYAGSGCSAWVDKPAWQQDANCPGRMVADVAAVADPRTGVAVYHTYDAPGWVVAGGTSASAPLIAGIIALAGDPARFSDASYLYSHASGLNDVTDGSNSTPVMDCGGDYQCTAVTGYDGPTGVGTPNGLAAFE
ncbi:S53 family peptidase [Amycolatopsis taiwanensis]|uniref:S53 family peptidase n=1 Tax=Amycolatopsis taiwanensis TaxID=342230 RepID=UPI0004AC8750|nr:S53 family peptidase [Amycolatopsis taiwanensis]